jgi:Polysaccharide deacetylase
MCPPNLRALAWLVLYALLLGGQNPAPRLAGVVVEFENYDGPATIVARSVEHYKLQIDVDPQTERGSLAIRVELPTSGRAAWPAADVEVRDARGRALTVRRSGIEWQKLLLPVPAVRDTYFVQAIEPPGGRPSLPTENERSLRDPATGLSLSIARWYDGRQAALSIRFDDSHPTHLSKAIPMLRRYGFRGTFMINPGGGDFEDHRAEWEACARRGDQEFANHSMHHRGAVGDAAMEAEIGEAAKAIWGLFPGKSKLAALNLGGGTVFETTHTLRYYLDKYYLFDASQDSTGMDDTYGNRVANFRRTLGQHLERGLWCRIHYHSIGEGLSSSEANFRAVLDIAQEHEAALWIAGMADIHKYQTERGGSALARVRSDRGNLTFRLSCRTDPEIYDQPLTIEVTTPTSWPADRVVVQDTRGKARAIRRVQVGGQARVRFDVAPRAAAYTVALGPGGPK